jgi:hypothetical protein
VGGFEENTAESYGLKSGLAALRFVIREARKCKGKREVI